MKKILALTILMGLSSFMALAADDHPFGDLFLGFDYTRANSATDVPAFSMNGGAGQFAFNFNKYIGFVAEMGGVHNGNISSNHIDNTFTDYLFGPRVSLRFSRITPYFQILFGGGHYSYSEAIVAEPVLSPTQPIYLPGQIAPVTSNAPITLRAVGSQTAFAMAVGGGLDIKISNHVTYRAIELDYLLSRLQNPVDLQDKNQNNLRFLTGFDFTFGAR